MKTAILISGELRTFSICRPTMTFLDDPNADIYVSTWDHSIVENEKLNLYVDDEVTEDNILKILDRPATIMVEPLSCIEEKKYNSKMIHRWLAGMQMILDSGKDYDYVLVTRPDLYFNHTHPSMFTLDSLIADGDKQFAWYEKDNVLQDNLFFAKFDTMKELFARLSIQDWQNTKEQDWHTWWKDFVGWTEVKRLGGYSQYIFCRSIVKVGMTYHEVSRCYVDWRDMQIMSQIQIGNRDKVVKDWGEAEVLKAEAKSFERYKVPKPKIAVLVCGMIRQVDVTLPSWSKLLEIDADWYLSTWDKTSQGYSSEMFSSNVSDDFLELFDFYNVSSYEEDEKFKSFTSRCGSNSLRYLYLLNHFRDKLTTYDKIVIIRPDTFIHIESKELFERECFYNTSVLSNIVRENFIQDFMIIVPPTFFENLNVVNEWASKDLMFNPHIKWLEYFKILELQVKRSNTFAVILARPNSRGKNNLNIRSVYNDWLLWERWHTS